VCMCLSVSDHIFGTTRPIFTKIFARSSSGVVVIVLRFVDDVIFSRKPRLLDVAAQLKRSAHTALGLAINCAQ